MDNTGTNVLRIKGMVCRRCISTVKDIFMQAGFEVTSITLGEVTYKPHTSDASLQKAAQQLIAEGFQPLGDKQSRIIARIKELVEEHLSGPEHHDHTFSQMVTAAIPMEYGSVSTLFAETEGLTLEKYVIGRRTEKSKELLKNPELSLTDIAFQLGYSSVHHFSNQFKHITGMTPSRFRLHQKQ